MFLSVAVRTTKHEVPFEDNWQLKFDNFHFKACCPAQNQIESRMYVFHQQVDYKTPQDYHAKTIVQHNIQARKFNLQEDSRCPTVQSVATKLLQNNKLAKHTVFANEVLINMLYIYTSKSTTDPGWWVLLCKAIKLFYKHCQTLTKTRSLVRASKAYICCSNILKFEPHKMFIRIKIIAVLHEHDTNVHLPVHR